MQMSQIFHIFRKDVRHHWLEILLCQAALVAYCWNEVSGWSGKEGSSGSLSRELWSPVIIALLPLTWWFLVFRVVQSESLVGDRQFWVTRPYEWKKLLAAKVSFVLVFINVPVLLAAVFLLFKAGYAPAPHLLGLLWMQLLLIQVPLLPIAALAAVTRNVAQGLLALLVVVLFMAGMAALAWNLPLPNTLSSSGVADWIVDAVLMIACLAAIVLQYARRKAGPARVWLAGGAGAITLIVIASTYFAHGERQYPLPSAGQRPHMRLALDDVNPKAPKDAPDKDEAVEIWMPMVTSELQEHSLARVDGIMITIEAPDGFRWNSDWLSSIEWFGPGDNHWRELFKMDHKTFERLKSVPVKVRVSVAATIFRERDARNFTTTSREFTVPDVGRCRIQGDYNYFGNQIQCRSPLLKPSLVVMRADPAISTCPAPNNADEKQSPARTAFAWESENASGPAEYGVSPVESFVFHSFYVRARICPGTPISFSFPSFAARTRAEFEVSGFKLDDYREGNFMKGSSGIGVRVH